jgi:hypothetical protein
MDKSTAVCDSNPETAQQNSQSAICDTGLLLLLVPLPDFSLRLDNATASNCWLCSRYRSSASFNIMVKSSCFFIASPGATAFLSSKLAQPPPNPVTHHVPLFWRGFVFIEVNHAHHDFFQCNKYVVISLSRKSTTRSSTCNSRHNLMLLHAPTCRSLTCSVGGPLFGKANI